MKTIIVSIIFCFYLIGCPISRQEESQKKPKKLVTIFLYIDIINKDIYESLMSLKNEKFNGKTYLDDSLSRLDFVYIPSNSSQKTFSTTLTSQSQRSEVARRMSPFFYSVQRSYINNKNNIFSQDREILDAFEKMLALTNDPAMEYKYIFISDMLESSGGSDIDLSQCKANGRFRFTNNHGECQSDQINEAITQINDNKNKYWIHQNLIDEYAELDKSKININIFTSNLSQKSNGVYTAKDALNKFWKELFSKAGFNKKSIKINRIIGSTKVI